MDNKEIEAKIEAVLAHELLTRKKSDEYPSQQRTYIQKPSLKDGILYKAQISEYDPRTDTQNKSWIQDGRLIFPEGNYSLNYPNLVVLQKLAAQLKNETEQKKFEELLGQKIQYQNRINTAPLIFEFFLKDHKIEKAFRILSKIVQLIDTSEEIEHSINLYHCLLPLSDILKHENPKFTEKEIEKIKEKIKQIRGKIPVLQKHDTKVMANSYQFVIDEVITEILEQFTEFKYRQIIQDLEEIQSNEIKKDQKELEKKIKQSHLQQKQILVAYIGDFDQQYQNAKTPIDYKKCLDTTRSFLEGITNNICIEVEKKINKPIKKNEKGKIDFKPAKGYLHLHKITTREENNLLDAIWGILSDDGTHELETPQEKARLAKNMTIEVALLLIKKLERMK